MAELATWCGKQGGRPSVLGGARSTLPVDVVGVLGTDGRIRGSYHEHPTEVPRYRNTLTRPHNLARHPEESRTMIRRRLEELS